MIANGLRRKDYWKHPYFIKRYWKRAPSQLFSGEYVKSHSMEDQQKKNWQAGLPLFMKSTGYFNVDNHVNGNLQFSSMNCYLFQMAKQLDLIICMW